ncbi:hypothetical protein E3N88_05746 [Mikania micrantha]|uniref:Uncharacterized protein n=1 Tax=Mikania micrantha TaxID=192012 RepID=A0A5N6PP47_9ASTR|nr:hypothetical protein E3N88_05746 [Mikania micrantha]
MENVHKTNHLKDDDNDDDDDQPPHDHLSGSYIRSLVKHLTSTKPKDSINANHKLPESVNSNGECVTDHSSMEQESPPLGPPPPPPPPVKKQVRRRRHTSKPYQERLLNMAEARREIVTALKFHRASMKQRETTAGKPYPQLDQPSGSIAATCTTVAGNYLECYSGSPQVPYHWAGSGPPPLPSLNHENLDFALPNQTLGLNLSFQDFINLDANLYHNPLSNFPSTSSTSLSPSSSASSSAVAVSQATTTAEEVVATTSTTTSSSSSSSSSSGAMMSGDLHHTIDEEEMEEIRWLGEKHQMEWNDTMNSLMSMRWFKFLKNINEIEPENEKFDFNDEINPFDQDFEFPSW